MASDNFNRANENPLASPWSTFISASWPGLDLVSNAVKNGEGSAQDTASIRLDSTELVSQCVVTTVGGRDGGPVICCDGSGNGYFLTNHDATNLFIYRIASGGYTQIASVAGVYQNNDVVKLRRSGNDIIASINGGDVLAAINDTTFMTGSPGMLCFSDTIVLDDWTDGADAGGGEVHYIESLEVR